MNVKEGRIAGLAAVLHLISGSLAVITLWFFLKKNVKKVLTGAIGLHLISSIIAIVTSTIQTRRIIKATKRN